MTKDDDDEDEDDDDDNIRLQKTWRHGLTPYSGSVISTLGCRKAATSLRRCWALDKTGSRPLNMPVTTTFCDTTNSRRSSMKVTLAWKLVLPTFLQDHLGEAALSPGPPRWSCPFSRTTHPGEAALFPGPPGWSRVFPGPPEWSRPFSRTTQVKPTKE